jgi:hypothetical protein
MVVLDDAQEINPNILDFKLSGYGDGVLEKPREQHPRYGFFSLIKGRLSGCQ